MLSLASLLVVTKTVKHVQAEKRKVYATYGDNVDDAVNVTHTCIRVPSFCM